MDEESVKPGTDAAPAAPAAPEANAANAANAANKEIEDKVVEMLKTCFDPEIPVNIYELGLIYSIDVAEDRAVAVRMTLTSPMCPVAGSLPPEVEMKVRAVPGVTDAKVEVVWDPPWDPTMMTEAAKLQLNFM